MHTHTFLLTILFSAILLHGESFTLSPSGERQWRSPLYKIPDGRPPMRIRMRTVTTGPVQHHIRLQWFDGSGKSIGTFLSRPPFHYPVEELLNKPVDWAQTVLPLFYPVNAEKVQIVIDTADFRNRFPNLPEPGKTTFEQPEINWLYRVCAEKPLNWFDMTGPVAFSANLPQDVVGLRGIVLNSDGEKVADISCKGARWLWENALPGFYQVKFFYLGKDGKQIPVTEKFYAMSHITPNGAPVQLKKTAVFQRDFQNFAVTEKRERTDRNHPFGANVGTPREHDPHFTSLQDAFAAINLCGLNSFIRWHHAPWDKIEAERGKYDWRIADHFLQEAENNGFPQNRVIFNTFGTPRWNSPKPRNSAWITSYRFFAPLELKPWGEYLKACSKRYPEIRMWELWNEPHLPGGSIFWQESSPKQFTDLMKTGYEALKSVNPANIVIHGGIGMRYMPFYDAETKLGVQKYYDRQGTHCVYSHEPFFAINRKYGAPDRKFIETEWHANLYNCSAPVLPTEESLCFRMLLQLAQMLNINVEQIAAFNLFTGIKMPETAKFFAADGGIQQVTGLFRSVPFKEPRLSALALRVATERFSGKIKPLGARYFGDGDQQIALFESSAGKVAFFWSQSGSGPLIPEREVDAQLRTRTVLDWEGRKVRTGQLRKRRVYFILAPDPAILNSGHLLKEISPRPLLPVLDKSVQGTYAPFSAPVRLPVKQYTSCNGKPEKPGFSASFAASFASDGLRLEVEVNDAVHHPECKGKKVWEADSIQFAVDATGKGDNADILEFAVGKNGLIYKVRTPVLNGDLPSDYSEAGVPLRSSRVEISRRGETTLYRIHVSPGDLYPFIFRNGQAVRFALLVNNNDGSGREGYLEWGSGIGGIKAPHLFGTLYRNAENPVAGFGKWRIFQNGNLTAGDPLRLESIPGKEDKASGIVCPVREFTPGARYRIAFRARGRGRLQAMVFGNVQKRVNFPGGELSPEWRNFSLAVEIPENETALNLAVFFWKEKNVSFELTGLTAEAIR